MSKPVNYSIGYLGAAIREIRKRRGVSQGELADLLGGSRNTISNWERGVHEPPPSAVEAIAKVLKVPVLDIEHLAFSLLHSAALERDRNRDRSLPVSEALASISARELSPGRVSEGGTSAYVARRAPPLPPVAYQRVYEHCRVLAEAGVPEELVEEARRLMSGETFNTLRAGPRDERSDESWLKDVEAAWLFVRDRMHALGFKL